MLFGRVSGGISASALVKELRGLHGIDDGQALEIEIRKPLVRPSVGLAGVGMLGIGHELLLKTEHFQRRAPDPADGLGRAIDQKPLRGLPIRSAGALPSRSRTTRRLSALMMSQMTAASIAAVTKTISAMMNQVTLRICASEAHCCP